MKKYILLSIIVLVLFFSMYLVNANYYFYQEIADSIQCGGYWNVSYPCSNAYDNNWSTFGTYLNSSGATLYLNYTKPNYATNGSLWQVKTENPQQEWNDNLTICSSTINCNPTGPYAGEDCGCINIECFNQSILQLRLDISGTFVGYYCYNSTKWVRMLYYATSYGSGANVYEEAMFWDMPEVILNSPINNSYSKANINFSCTPTIPTNLISPILTNLTLFGNWGGWHSNTTNFTPINNTPSIFPATLTDGSYLWNCLSCVNHSIPIPYYQENPNSQTFFGNWNISTQIYDGDWNTYGEPKPSGTGGLRADAIFSYIKPNNSLISSKWQVKYSCGTNPIVLINLSIPSSCWNYQTDNISMKFTSVAMGYDHYLSLHCLNGSGSQEGEGDYLGVSCNGQYPFIRIYEEAMWWDISTYAPSSSCFFSDTNYTLNIDTTFPSANYTSPTPNNEVVTSRQVIINISASDANPWYAWLIWNGIAEQNQSWVNGTILFTKNNLPNGNYSFNVSVYDLAGNNNLTETRWVYVNGTIPLVNLISPANNKYNNTLLTNFTCNSTATIGKVISNVTFYWNFNGTWLANETITGINQNNYIAGFYRNVSDKNITWNCFTIDNESESAFSTTNYTYIVDTTNPSVSINPSSDYNKTITTNNYALINFTISDTNLYNVILNWNGTNQSFTNTSGNFYFVNKTGLADGNYTFYAFANDYANNTNKSITYWIMIDAVGPVTTITFPTEGQTLTSTTYPPWLVTPTFTITDEFPVLTCSYNVTDIADNIIVANTAFGCSNTSLTFPLNSIGSYYFNVFAIGTNHNSTTRRLFLMSQNIAPSGGTGGVAVPLPVNQTGVCGNGVCEASYGESPLTCTLDCGQTKDIESLIRNNWKILVLIAGLGIAGVFLLRGKKRK